MNNFLGVMKLWIFFWGVITKLGYFGWSFLYILGLFLKIKVQNWIFWGVLNFKSFYGVCLIFLIFFRGNSINSRCWVQAYISRKN